MGWRRWGGAVALACMLVSGKAWAVGRDMVFEQKVIAQLEAMDPSQVPKFRAATAAIDAGKFDQAIDGFAGVHAAVPGFSAATRRLCGAEIAAHRDAAGLAHCREALATEASVVNQMALASALVSRQSVTDADRREAAEYVRVAMVKQPNDEYVQETACEVAMAQKDLDALDRCSTKLLSIAPDDPQTHVLRAFALGARGDLSAGEKELDRAHALGLPDAAYHELRDRFESARPFYARAWSVAWPVFAVWLLGLLLLFAVGSALSALTLRAAQRPPVAQASGDVESTSGERFLRAVYRGVVTLAAIYFYVSIPLVAASVIAFAGALVVGAFMIGQIPIKLLLIVVLVAVYTLAAIFRGLTARSRDQAPGVPLDLAEEPKLRAVLEETAAKVGTRRVDTVYLVPSADIAVTERGGFFKQLRGRAERALILGVGALDGLSVRPLKAVLAHEYGHFRNEDTAGGGVALAARRSLMLTALHMAARGAATWFNPAWWFVRGYGAVYLRISQGASRLQEVLADRWAVRAYGGESFVTGLRHVVARTLAFDEHVEASLREVIDRKAALTNLYAYEPSQPTSTKKLGDALDELWNREPSPYDSHPRGADREAWARALGSAGSPPEAGDAEPAWSLFRDRAAIEHAMTREVRDDVQRRHGIVIAGG